MSFKRRRIPFFRKIAHLNYAQVCYYLQDYPLQRYKFTLRHLCSADRLDCDQPKSRIGKVPENVAEFLETEREKAKIVDSCRASDIALAALRHAQMRENLFKFVCSRKRFLEGGDEKNYHDLNFYRDEFRMSEKSALLSYDRIILSFLGELYRCHLRVSLIRKATKRAMRKRLRIFNFLVGFFCLKKRIPKFSNAKDFSREQRKFRVALMGNRLLEEVAKTELLKRKLENVLKRYFLALRLSLSFHRKFISRLVWAGHVDRIERSRNLREKKLRGLIEVEEETFLKPYLSGFPKYVRKIKPDVFNTTDDFNIMKTFPNDLWGFFRSD
ncbi:hypothetical protein MHBO_001870 [Bonamia ostreae]|uniref:Uncharacterized protein n=1 Tax=Bonamia ostreae TaxID=126728 RepID=A0ABV2AKH1_9EUKA